MNKPKIEVDLTAFENMSEEETKSFQEFLGKLEGALNLVEENGNTEHLFEVLREMGCESIEEIDEADIVFPEKPTVH